MNRHLTRKDIAALIDPRMTPLQISRNERRLGLDKARAQFNGRVIWYRTSQVLRILRDRGFDV